MEWITVLEVALLGGSVGLGAYCYTCAAHVWRRRNAPNRAARTPGRLLSTIRRGAGAVMVAGLLAMAVSIGWLVAVGHDGLLEGEGLFTVRQPAGLEVVQLASHSHVEPGAVLARFHSPEAEAQIGVLTLRRESLAAESEALQHQVLSIDPEIAQELTDSNALERTLRMNLSDLVLEKERLDRDSLREQLARREDIKRRELEIRKLAAEAEQAQSALQLCREEHDRSETLRERKVTTEQQHSEKEAELEAALIEVRKIEEQLEQTREQKAELEQGLERFRQLGDRQSRNLQTSIAAAQDRLGQVAVTQGELQDRRDADLRRAARHRDECLKKIAVETAQTERQLAAEQAKLERRAPFAGQIAYRAAAPGNVGTDEPLLVLAPPAGLRLIVRLPNWMKPALEDAAGIACNLLEDLEREEQRRFVESRFAARLHGWTELAAHPGYGLAEFTCDAPAEAVRLLARGEQIAVRLVWRPPLQAMPAFMMSLAIASVAAMVWVATHAQTTSKPTPSSPARSVNGNVATRRVSIEYGEEGELIRLLGTQLREMTLRGELDANIIAAAEWALMRHRHRAVRLLAAGLGDGAALCDRLESLVNSIAEDEPSAQGNSNGRRATALCRLVAVLRAAAPEGSYERICRVAGKLARPASRDANGHRHFEFAGAEIDRRRSNRDGLPR